MKSEQDEVLIRNYLEGQPEAYRKVNLWIARAVDSRHWGLQDDREDILQDVHQRLFTNLVKGKFRGSSSLKTYAVQIAKYTCIEFLRRKIRFRNVDLDSIELQDANPGPEQVLAEAERRELAAGALANLPKGCRQLFEMIFDHRMSYQEISRQLAVAEGTVKSRASRCRDLLMKGLRTKLGE